MYVKIAKRDGGICAFFLLVDLFLHSPKKKTKRTKRSENVSSPAQASKCKSTSRPQSCFLLTDHAPNNSKPEYTPRGGMNPAIPNLPAFLPSFRAQSFFRPVHATSALCRLWHALFFSSRLFPCACALGHLHALLEISFLSLCLCFLVNIHSRQFKRVSFSFPLANVYSFSFFRVFLCLFVLRRPCESCMLYC